ncbi:NADPH:quinone oxidoreductase family protein [Mycolicibacterium sp. P9-64]|uniref:NADPH:quinone oxidoreductase family protein n=1 Tax=Mycolicibacterium sp. P9-64 TaxID=2024612 RepID=UPI0011EFAD48|nr:NADPH:quinone oxidoreductase family protein [Mycolicibacterium sp. P9-64]KAA0084530.1 NADPH:quinone oxidoreductase family protein [Mycolicibacterium sp. P9-64]
MRAVHSTNYDGPTGVKVLEIDAPERAADEVVVEVRAVAPAFPDLLMSRGEYQVKPVPPFTPGSDFTGVVVDGPPGSEFMPGARVAGCLSFGAAAERVAVTEDRLYPLPEDLDFVQGAAIPMNYLTAHFALVTRGHLAEGDWVMVLGASGGVGLAAIQVAAGLGAQVVAVVSSPQRATVALASGAHYAVLRDDVPLKVRDLTGGRGVNLVVDVVGGDIRNALRSLAPLGRLLAVGFASGEIPTVKVNRLLLTNTDVRGVESDYLWTAGISRIAWDELMSLYRKGFIKPVVQETGSFDDYGRALTKLDERQVVGRIVLTP